MRKEVRDFEGKPVLAKLLVLCPPPSTQSWVGKGRLESVGVERSSALLSAFNSRKAASYTASLTEGPSRPNRMMAIAIKWEL